MQCNLAFALMWASCSRPLTEASEVMSRFTSMPTPSSAAVAGSRHLAASPSPLVGGATVIANVQPRSRMVEAARRLFFRGEDPLHGNELWMSDGLTAEIVEDLVPGPGSSMPSDITEFMGRLYFAADGADYRRSLYWHDLQALVVGNSTATAVPPTASSGSTSPAALCRYHGLGPDALYFGADGGSVGIELFRYTGSGVPQLVADSYPGEQSSNPQGLTVFDGRLFYSAASFFEGQELWWYNGTTVPEILVDFLYGPGGSSPRDLTPTAAGMFMRSNTGTSGTQLFLIRAGGTPAERPSIPELVYDIPGGSSKPRWMTMVDSNTLAMSAATTTTQNANSQQYGSELWAWNPAMQPDVIIAADIWYGYQGSSPTYLTSFVPAGGTAEQLYFGAYDGPGMQKLWAFNDSARPTSTPSVSASPTISFSPTPSISFSATPTISLTPTPSPTPSVSSSPSSTPSASASPSRYPEVVAPGRETYMQVAVVGSLESRFDPRLQQVFPPTLDMPTLRRTLPQALIEATTLQETRGIASSILGEQWVDRLQVYGAKMDSGLNTRTNVLVRIAARSMAAQMPEVQSLAVVSSSSTRKLIDERLVAKAAKDRTAITNTSVGLQLELSLGAIEARTCACFEGAWIVPAAGEQCPFIAIDTRILTMTTIAFAFVVPSFAIVLFASKKASWSGTLTVMSVGLQMLDVISDISFTYQLWRERSCEYPFAAKLVLASVIGSVIVNFSVTVFLLRFWPVDGMPSHEGQYWSDTFALAFLSLFGIKALDLLTSQLFNRPGLSLYSNEGPTDMARRRELSHKVRILGLPQLVIEDAVQFGVQVFVLSLGGGNNQAALIAIIATGLNVLRHVLGATLSSAGLRELNDLSQAKTLHDDRQASIRQQVNSTRSGSSSDKAGNTRTGGSNRQSRVTAAGRDRTAGTVVESGDGGIELVATSSAETAAASHGSQLQSPQGPTAHGPGSLDSEQSSSESRNTMNPLLGAGGELAEQCLMALEAGMVEQVKSDQADPKATGTEESTQVSSSPHATEQT